ncbi:MAG: agmatinase [Ardenticatenaceae bacterium]
MTNHNTQTFGTGFAAFAGIPSFMRQPISRDLSDVDVAIVGVPFDSGATTLRSGTRMGPRKIREYSLLIEGFHHVYKLNPIDMLNVVDYGDVNVELVNIEANIEMVSKQVSHIVNSGATVIALGGDHSISYPLLKAHAQKYGPVAVVHFDSHTDTEAGYHNHGTPFADAIKAGAIDTSAYLQVGIRGPWYPIDPIAEAQALGVEVLTIDECFEMGIRAVIKHIQQKMQGKQVYVSLDIDSVDPAYAPGTGTPEVGGFTSYQILQLVRGLKGLDLIGFDLVEVNPSYDHGGITSILGANLAYEFLSLTALRKK